MAGNRKFVVATRRVVTPQGISVEKNEVGYIEAREKDLLTIFFVRPWKKVEMGLKDVKEINVKKTGDGFSKKICNVCQQLKNTKNFDKNQNGKNNRPVRRPSCKSCRVGIDGTFISREDRKKWNKVKPEFEPFVCPICKKRTIAGVTSKVVLEHSHLTGKVGGWICDSCNTGLGRFRDDPKLLESAIKFLKKSY